MEGQTPPSVEVTLGGRFRTSRRSTGPDPPTSPHPSPEIGDPSPLVPFCPTPVPPPGSRVPSASSLGRGGLRPRRSEVGSSASPHTRPRLRLSRTTRDSGLDRLLGPVHHRLYVPAHSVDLSDRVLSQSRCSRPFLVPSLSFLLYFFLFCFVLLGSSWGPVPGEGGGRPGPDRVGPQGRTTRPDRLAYRVRRRLRLPRSSPDWVPGDPLPTLTDKKPREGDRGFGGRRPSYDPFVPLFFFVVKPRS